MIRIKDGRIMREIFSVKFLDGKDGTSTIARCKNVRSGYIFNNNGLRGRLGVRGNRIRALKKFESMDGIACIGFGDFSPALRKSQPALLQEVWDYVMTQI